MNNFKKYVLLILLFLAAEVNAQTKTLSRMVATSHFEYDGTAYKMSDTETFVYGIGRGGDDFYNLPYDYSLSLKARTPSSLDSSIRNEKTYNAANKVLTHKQQYYRNAALGWSNTTFISYSYDWRNNETEQIVQKWNDVTMAWENQDLILKTYDANSNLITQITQEWNKTLGIWVNKRQFINSYDAKKRITNILYLLWDGTNWYNSTHDSYIFDTKDNLVSTLKYRWNNGLSSWDSSGKVETSFSSTNKKLIETNSDYYSGSWIQQRISEYFYNSNDSIYLFKYKDWNASKSVWTNQTKIDYLYNTAGQLIYQKSQRGLNDTGWHNFWQRDYEYDIAMNSVTQVHSSWRDVLNKYDTGIKITMIYNSYNQLTKYVLDGWDSSTKKFNPYEIYNYYYEEFTAGIKELGTQNGAVNVYPIPASNQLNVEVNWSSNKNFTIHIYDIGGRTIENCNQQNIKKYQKIINLSNYVNGHYFLVATTENGERISRTFVVQH